MTRKETNIYLCSILSTALETEPEPFPESMAYLAMGSRIDDWNVIKALLDSAGLATFKGHAISLTDKGRALAKKIDDALAGDKP